MSKPVLLFVHGFRGNHLGLESVAHFFKAKDYPVFIPDLPPARSTTHATPSIDFTPDGYATALANYILRHQLEQPILIGHSMGSIIAAATAAKFPELLGNQIFFLSPIAVRPPRAITSLSPLSAVTPNKVAGYLSTRYLIVPKDKTLLKETLDTTYRCSENFTSRRDVARAARFSSKYAISDFDFTQNCVFIAGEADRLNSPDSIKQVAAKYGGQAIFLKNSGHLINYECPAELAQTIEAFLSPSPSLRSEPPLPPQFNL